MVKRTIALLLLIPSLAFAQKLKQMEFRNQELTEILLVLAQIGGVSIVPDETVRGTASYFFAETEFADAMDAFFAAYRLYYKKEGNVYFVSRVGITYNATKGLVTLDAEDVDVQLVLRALSRTINRTILYDALPRDTVTIHAKDLTPTRVVEIIAKRFPGYQVDDAPDNIYVRKLQTGPGGVTMGSGSGANFFSRAADGTYSIEKDSARFLDLLDDLFRKEKKEYSLLLRGDYVIERLRFSGKTFEQMLRLVLEQANADYSVRNDIYYFFEIQRKDVVKKLKQNIILQVRYISVQDIAGLLPPDLASGGFYRFDKPSNSVILTGSSEEIEPIRDFVINIDKPQEGRQYFRFQPSFIKAKDAMSLLPQYLATASPVMLPDGSAFLLSLTPDLKVAADAFLAAVDRRGESYPVKLKYIRTEDLMKTLPPSVVKDELIDSGNPTTVFYIGSPEKRERFLRELEVLDKPKPLIRYDILIMQFRYNNGVGLTTSSTVKGSKDDKSYSISGTFDKLLNINFDVISQFGVLFAEKLSLSLSQSDSRVFADTTLTALSGGDVKFQNTSTYRYKDYEVDPDTGKLKGTGVTREISSGLIIGINGWVSGDGMITMDVNSTVSKRGGDSSGTSQTTLPETSERVVNSKLRTASGEPIVLSGLIQRDRTQTSNKIPILGDIPLLGLLFQNLTISEEANEMVIYIVPRVLQPVSDPTVVGLQMERLYRQYVQDVKP